MNRSDVFVETKVPGCGNPLENTTRNPFTCYKSTKANLESDLEKLNLKWVDLVLLHFPPFPSFGEPYFGLRRTLPHRLPCCQTFTCDFLQ